MFDALIVLRQDIRSGLLMSLGLHESNCSGPRGTLIFDMTQDIRGDFPPNADQGRLSERAALGVRLKAALQSRRSQVVY